ncbi:hypothetical protein PAMP_005276 [Pampus punctatissimus]
MSRERRKTENQGGDGDRGQWANKTEYILVVAGNVVGLGNVWRFPYLCYKNGGGAFLVPYCLLAVLVGIPLFLLESSIGQYTQEGFITTWRKLCPLAQANCVSLSDSMSPNLTANWTMLTNTTSPATEFWERRVLAMSGGIEELGSVRWELALCLLVCWVFSYFSIWKGVRSSGKVWIEAGSQICFSYSLTIGTLSVLSSYNQYKNNCYKDCFWLCLLNSGTSFVAGFVVFSVLGFMAQKQGVTVDAVAESGPGLAFIAYPQATAMMPLPQFWTVCFFLMLLFLSVDTHGGIYIFQLVDYYGCTRAFHYFMALYECLALAWSFGADRVINIIEDMTGQRPSVYFKLCWRYIIPLLSLISLILYLFDYTHLRINDRYVYPDWAYTLGWAMTLSSVLLVPLWAAGQMCLTTGTFRQRLSFLCRPANDSSPQRREMGEDVTTVEPRMSAGTA